MVVKLNYREFLRHEILANRLDFFSYAYFLRRREKNLALSVHVSLSLSLSLSQFQCLLIFWHLQRRECSITDRPSFFAKQQKIRSDRAIVREISSSCPLVSCFFVRCFIRNFLWPSFANVSRSVVKRYSISFRIRKNSTDSKPDVVSLLSAVFRMGIIAQSMVQWKKRFSTYKYALNICNKVFLKLHFPANRNQTIGSKVLD